MMDIGQELIDLLRDAAHETGYELREELLVPVAAYTAERASFLSTLIGQPGFSEAVRAERDNVALKAGIAAVGSADKIESRLIGIVQAILAIGARVLSIA